MYGVGTGRLIAERYALNERRAHLGSIEVWSAVDSTLGREVSVTVFPSTLPRAEAIVDAARRSAALNDHRLVRVLDVGSTDEVSWLVEESLTESVSIADLVARGPLPPEEARRIAGEVASGLAVAAERGLHHLHITPHSVRRTDGGLIKVAGLATAAALEGTEESDGAKAERIDAVATVALMYAAMTTRWPLSTPVPGLQSAPRIVGGVAAPSEIAIAVPPDLDAICRATLNHDTGPRTPRELVSRIAPWSGTLVRHAAPRVSPVARPVIPAATEEIPAVNSSKNHVHGRTRVPSTVPAGPMARVREHREQEREARAASTRRRLEERRADPGFLNLPETLEEQRNKPLPPPAPLLPPTPEVEGRHAKLILAIVAGIIILAMAFAVPTLLGVFSSDKPAGQNRSTTSPAPGATKSSPSGASTSKTATQGSGAAITPVGISSFDPQGDGKENDGSARLAIDGAADTEWVSEGYKNSATMGGTKEGVGLIVELPRDTTISKVGLTLTDQAQDVEVYAADERSLDAATKLGSTFDASGDVELNASTPTAARYLIVWVTKAAEDTDGKYRARIAEIRAS